MVKVYCDRCNTEVESLDALLQFSIEVTEQPNRTAWSYVTPQRQGTLAPIPANWWSVDASVRAHRVPRSTLRGPQAPRAAQ